MINRIKNLYSWLAVLVIWLIIISIIFPVFEFTKNCEGSPGFEGRGTIFDCAVDVFVWVLVYGIFGIFLFGIIFAIYKWIKSKL
tara:strand:+ start:302 stop:553 length:252 start_codon:yes stop_codon:yes gene_type:complete